MCHWSVTFAVPHLYLRGRCPPWTAAEGSVPRDWTGKKEKRKGTFVLGFFGFFLKVRLLSQFHIFLILFTPSSRWKMSFFQSSFFLRWQIPNSITGLSSGAQWWAQTRNFGPELQPGRPKMEKLHLKRHEPFFWSSCSDDDCFYYCKK